MGELLLRPVLLLLVPKANRDKEKDEKKAEADRQRARPLLSKQKITL